MTLTMYDIAITPLLRGLHNVSHLLHKAEASSIPTEKLLASRLHPTMQPLPYQIQRLSDSAKGAVVRLTGVAPTAMEDNEKTMEELHERIAKTIKVLEGVKAGDLEGSDEKEIVLKTRMIDRKLNGKEFVTGFLLPNFYFHMVTTYALLRMEGVDVGKLDYLDGKS